jgi:hypothetical protein
MTDKIANVEISLYELKEQCRQRSDSQLMEQTSTLLHLIETQRRQINQEPNNPTSYGVMLDMITMVSKFVTLDCTYKQ